MNIDMPSRKQVSVQQSALLALKQARARIEAVEYAKSEPLAIIGMACRFPGGATSPAAYWQMLRNGADAIVEVPADRWDSNAFYDANPEAPGKMMTRQGGFLQQVDQFDAPFFGISPREAVSMDPQQRLILEVGWEALEHAGCAPDSLVGSQTGVFLGASTYDYSLLSLKSPTALENTDIYLVTGNATNIIAGRLSYVLGLRGPSLVVDTACSSSLVSIHLACQSLRSGECDLALAGGVNIILAPELSIMFSKSHMLAADGRCKTFDAAADGFGRGEGCGIVVLRRLSDALTHGAHILAVIRGSAVNQDGRSNGLTAPNGQAQQAVIRKALANAHVAPAEVGYIEAHGTGTSLGDPIEVQALAAVLREGRAARDHVHVGTVKTNIGHLEAAAGIAGLIKAVLMLQHQEIPPNLHLNVPNPYIPWDDLSVTIPTHLTPWPANERSRIAGVSSFGFSGTNAHIILEEAPQRLPTKVESERPLHLLCLSGKSEGALRAQIGQYTRYLDENPSVSLADVTHMANSGRTHFTHRAALVAGSLPEMREKLVALADFPAISEDLDGVHYAQVTRTDQPPIAFLFTGQGAQYAGMGQRLYATLPLFRKTLEQCDELLRPYLKQSLLSVLYPEPGQAPLLDDTTYTQPALFALEYALAQVWRSWGITPSAVLGHSVGEYVAACLAGIFSLEDGLRLIAERGRLMGSLPRNGAMAAVFASETEVADALAPYRGVLTIAAINGPNNSVISGEAVALNEALAELQKRGIRVERLAVSHAFHSPLMDPILDALDQITARMTFAEPQIELITNLTGQPLGPKHTLDGHYWRKQARETVRFKDGIASLHTQGYSQFIEIGPSPVLLGMGQRCLPEEANVWLPSLRKNRDDWQSMLNSLSTLYVQGAAIDWNTFDRDYSYNYTSLPTYPFQRQRYWVVERDFKATVAASAGYKTTTYSSQRAEDDSRAETPDNWLYHVEWQLQPPIVSHLAQPQEVPGHWIILADRGGVGQELARIFKDFGVSCDLHFADRGEQELDKVLSQLPACRGVIHLWSLDATASFATTSDTLRQDQERHCASTLRVMQALIAAEQLDKARIWIVTRGTQPIGQLSEMLAIAQAPMWGLGRVIALEHPELWGGLIDLDPATPDDEAIHILEEVRALENTPALRGEQPGKEEPTTHFLHEDQVAWRSGQRYVARLARTKEMIAQPLALRSDATYAITGGFGGLGGIVANWMAQQGVRHVALISRNASPDDARVRALEQMGIQVMAIQADVSQTDQAASALRLIETTMPPLRGIIHAAGVIEDGLINGVSTPDWTRFERVLAPKIEGAWNLHSLTQTQSLDFFVYFSSTASIFGSPGQGNYAAANAFLDALTHYRQANGLPALTINWGPWDTIGMTATVHERSKKRWATRGIALLAPSQGIEVLASLLQRRVSQVTVLRIDWSRFRDGLVSDMGGINTDGLINGAGYGLINGTGHGLINGTGHGLINRAPTIPPLFAELVPEMQQQAPVVHESHPAQLRPMEQFLALKHEQRPEFIRTILRRRAGHILGMNPQEVSLERNLLELGMDSLMMMEVIHSIKQDFQLTLYPREVYEHPSIDTLAVYLNGELTEAQEKQNAGPSAMISSPELVDASFEEPGARKAVPLLYVISENVASEDQEGISTKSSTPGIAFLLSGPRSGSTLLRVMLAGHPRLFCPPELHLLSFETLAQQRQELERSYLQEGLQRALMELLNCDAVASKVLLDHWSAENLSIHEVYTRLQQMAAPRLLLDKSPTYAGSMDTLRRAATLFAGAKYICLVRHPYAAIESFLRTRMHKLIGAENEDAFQVAEQVWVQTNQNMLTFFEQIDPEQRQIVRYEDLVTEPKGVTDAICTFLGIPSDEAVLRPYEGQRMTDGVHGQSLAIGDPNFLNHDRIDADLGNAWKKIVLPRSLGLAARQLAAKFQYELREEGAITSTRSQFAIKDFRVSSSEEGHLPPFAVGDEQLATTATHESYVQARGLRLCINAWGPKEGPVIVFLHGILDQSTAWEEVATSLARRGYHVIVPDLRGHGCSMHAPSAGGYHLLDYVADLDSLMSNPESGIPSPDGRPVVLVGHSMGASVAAIFASLRPERVSALVLIEGLMSREPSEDEFSNLLNLRLHYLTSSPQHATLPDSAAAAQRLLQAMPSLSLERSLRMAERLTQPCENGVCWRWDAALLTRSDITYDTLAFTPAHYHTLLSKVTAPTTLIYGQADNPNLVQLQASLPSATVEIVHGGHNLHIDAPAALADVIAQSVSQAGCTPQKENERKSLPV